MNFDSRKYVLIAAVLFITVVFILRLLWIQVIDDKWKASAANMAERVFTTLGPWVTLDDAALDAAISDAGIAHSTPRLRKAARELFASALETPGGLKVQTIHALCTRLLQQFPFEANVPARFTVLDDRDQTEMMERASLAVMLDASRAPDSAIGRALLAAMASAADVTFKEATHGRRSIHVCAYRINSAKLTFRERKGQTVNKFLYGTCSVNHQCRFRIMLCTVDLLCNLYRKHFLKREPFTCGDGILRTLWLVHPDQCCA